VAKTAGLRAESREPPQRLQTGHEAVLAAAHGYKPRQALKSTSDRPFGNGEDAIAFIVTDERI